MRSIALKLRFSDAVLREARAWLVPGDEPQPWFEEWQRWDVNLSGCVIIPVAGIGVLTVLAADSQPEATLSAIPLGRVGSRLFLPINAETIPAVDADEIDRMIPASTTAALLYPNKGLFLFHSSDLLPIDKLLTTPKPGNRDWSYACVGDAWNTRLQSVEPSTIPSPDSILEEGHGDIGSRDHSHGLPPRPGEPREGLMASAQRTIRKSIAGWTNSVVRAVQGDHPQAAGGKATGSASKPDSDRGWLGALGSWANERLNSVSREVEEIRNREVLRLMHLLESSPDEGLKYAISFGTGAESRGLASLSAFLAGRNVNFSLARLGGGGPADYWQLHWKQQETLRNRYRELAVREIQLGRHRRAAYIFAELLNDLEAAANALRTGQHWREAAVLYEKRLQKPAAAAACLEEGKLFHEAIPLYASLGQFEKVGDLYDVLVDSDNAEAAWRTAVATHLSGQDYLSAARILSEKVKSDDEALAALDAGWPLSSQAVRCLTESFALLGRRGRHDETNQRIRDLRSSDRGVVWACHTVEALAPLVRTYPDRQTSALAADAVRVVAGKHLKGATGERRSTLLRAVQDCAQGDLLLPRDCRRFILGVEKTTRLPAGITKTRRSAVSRSPTLRTSFQLPFEQGFDSAVFVNHHEYLLAVAIEQGKWLPKIVRATWQGIPQEAKVISTKARSGSQPRLVSLVSEPRGGSLVLIGINSGEDFTCHFPASADFVTGANVAAYRRSDNAGRLLGLSLTQGILAAATETRQGGLLLEMLSVDPSGRQHVLNDSWEWSVGAEIDSVRIGRAGRFVTIGCGCDLWLLDPSGGREMISLPERIGHVACSAPFARARVVAAAQHGCYMLWLDGPAGSRRLLHFAEALTEPKICLTPNGYLVAASETGVEIYGVRDSSPLLVATLPPLRARPIAVLPTDRGDQFAILGSTLKVSVYEMPGRS